MRVLLVVIVVLGGVRPLAAQDSTAVEPLDARLFRAVYANEAPLFAGTMRAAEASALPLLVGTVPVVWGVTLATGADADPALRLTLAEGGAAALVFALKNVVRRPRPYRALRNVTARTRRFEHDETLDPHSFPSGHSALAFAVATSASLSAREWYVTVPALTWASAIALARVWHGVHFPLDVATGAAIGAGSAAVVHLLIPIIGLADEDDPPEAPVVVLPLGTLRVAL